MYSLSCWYWETATFKYSVIESSPTKHCSSHSLVTKRPENPGVFCVTAEWIPPTQPSCLRLHLYMASFAQSNAHNFFPHQNFLNFFLRNHHIAINRFQSFWIFDHACLSYNIHSSFSYFSEIRHISSINMSSLNINTWNQISSKCSNSQFSQNVFF